MSILQSIFRVFLCLYIIVALSVPKLRSHEISFPRLEDIPVNLGSLGISFVMRHVIACFENVFCNRVK